MISLLQCLAYLPSASAWIYTWHDPNDKMLSFEDDKPLSCKAMDNPKGNIYNWEPQDGHWCMFLYTNSNCENPIVGRTCKDYEWPNHVSGEHIKSFKVTNNTAGFLSTATTAESTTKATSSPSSTADATTSPASASATATNGPENSGSDSSISGGAIAGIVVGVLAAVAIAAILIFFLCWRRRKNGTEPNPTTRTESTSGMVELSQPDEEQSPVSEKPMYKSQGLRELTGSTGVSEIGSETERYEIGTEKHKSIPERYELDGGQYNSDRKA